MIVVISLGFAKFLRGCLENWDFSDGMKSSIRFSTVRFWFKEIEFRFKLCNSDLFTQFVEMELRIWYLCFVLYRCKSSLKPSQARPSPSRWSPLTPSTTLRPRSRIRKESPRISNVWSSPASNLRMAELLPTTTSRKNQLFTSS